MCSLGGEVGGDGGLGQTSQGVERARLEWNGLMWTSWRPMTGEVIVGALGRVGVVQIAGFGGLFGWVLGEKGGGCDGFRWVASREWVYTAE